MFIKKTYIDKSKIHGNGVFAGEKIKKGDIVWKFNKIIDKKINKEIFDNLDELTKFFIEKNGYLDKSENFYIISGDNDIFSNHSDNPNLIEEKQIKEIQIETNNLIASRNIEIGEELTQNYLEYIAEENFKFKMKN